jgi:hypothetical protein
MSFLWIKTQEERKIERSRKMNRVLMHNLAICILIFFAVFFGPIDAASANLFTDPNLVGYWQFDADANDSSQYENNGALAGNAAASNSVLVLDGNDDYVDIPNDVTLTFDNKISISLWAKWDNLSGWRTLVHGTTTGAWTRAYWLSTFSPQYMRWEIGMSAIDFNPGPLNTNEWYHIVATYDGSTAKVYVNSVQKTSFSVTGNVTNENGVCLGMTGDGYYPFDGSLDDVMIFDRVLQPWEVRQLYNQANKRYGYFSELVEVGVLQGIDCSATGEDSVALTFESEAWGDGSAAIGLWTEAGHYSVALGYRSEATGTASFAASNWAVASGYGSVALGCTTASGFYSTASGGPSTIADADYATAFGRWSTNDISESFTVGYGDYENPKVDFRVRSGLVNVYGDLDVSQKVTMATLVLPVKTTTGDPASPVEGQIYVNTADNKVRVYADGAWRDLTSW